MDIRHRITLLIALTFIAIFSIGGYAIFQARMNATEVKSVTEGVVPSALASSDLVSQLKQVQVATMTFVYAPSENLINVSKDRLAASKKLLQDGLDLQLRQATDDAQRGLVREAKESLSNYFSAIDESIQFKLAGQNDIAEANLFANVAQYQSELEQIVETLRVEKNRSKDSAINTLNENLSKTATGISIFTVINVLVLSAIGILLYRRIITPISQMQKTMSEITTSQDFTRQVPVERMDEIGRSIVAFNVMINKIQESSALLKQKTTDIQTMLQNMPQGILTITDGSKVHPEYSAYLETIFETKDIVGRDLMDLVFANTSLGADVLSQIEAVVGACIGEDAMNFEFNQHLMVGEIEKTMPDGRVKILDLNWSAITDDSDTTVRIMLCVRDVTELRKLAAEANKQKRELEIIGEILAVTQEKFHEFITTSIRFVDENELLIRDNPEHDAAAINQLFRNMHTIKGNARTYGFHHLTNIVHQAEQSYEELRKPHPVIAWDQVTQIGELLAVRDSLEHYARINEISLGRKGPGRRASVEHYVMVDRNQIQETLHRLETVNTGNIHELISARDAVRKTLRLLGTERFVETLESVLDSLPSLARELHKVPPMIDIQDNGYVVRTQASGMIKNVFMHLVRNSIDHGLEASEERSALGKPVAGTIRFQLVVEDSMLKIKLSDDGRGLSLAHIRKLAVEKGLIGPEEQPGDEEIAMQIFRPGFSTAEKITEVSGRGVGMDAVQDFVRRENGRIEIRFTDNLAGADFRQFETIVCLPESFAENANGFDFYATHASSHLPVEMGLSDKTGTL
ncbi:gliding motility regulatory protein [mine drainage metagenome]|uniref:histidine kinase n=1 Tax=mine drainage metagenome TaxID=410659 RepID=A0A1J5QU41_9ZZZZ